MSEGLVVGISTGDSDGSCVGLNVGVLEGSKLGPCVGDTLGLMVPLKIETDNPKGSTILLISVVSWFTNVAADTAAGSIASFSVDTTTTSELSSCSFLLILFDVRVKTVALKMCGPHAVGSSSKDPADVNISAIEESVIMYVSEPVKVTV